MAFYPVWLSFVSACDLRSWNLLLERFNSSCNSWRETLNSASAFGKGLDSQRINYFELKFSSSFGVPIKTFQLWESPFYFSIFCSMLLEILHQSWEFCEMSLLDRMKMCNQVKTWSIIAFVNMCFWATSCSYFCFTSLSFFIRALVSSFTLNKLGHPPNSILAT